MKKIVLDTGHGGKDPGAVGKTSLKLKEADVVLSVCKYAKQHLETVYDGVQALLTRSSNVSLELKERTDYANKNNADRLVSVHCNSAAATSAHGFESFTYTKTDATTETFRNHVHSKVYDAVKKRGITTDRGKKKENFHMVRETKMPAALIELGFISNSNEEKIMSTATFQKEVGIALAEGIAADMKLQKKQAKKEVIELTVDGKRIGNYSTIETAREGFEKYMPSGKEVLFKTKLV